MSRLFLVRHGQASFLERNYDKLSPKGEEQARILGEYWAGLNLAFDRVYSGPRVRQRETARIAGEAYKAAGMPWPEQTVLQEFDEFQAEAVMERRMKAADRTLLSLAPAGLWVWPCSALLISPRSPH
jgi:broad specificity phosphatase PhoE